MKNNISNKKIIIYLSILVGVLGVSFLIYKIASASINDAVIKSIRLESIVTGEKLDPEFPEVVTHCDSNGLNCTYDYEPSKDKSADNVIVKSFDKIKYNFIFDLKDSSDEFADVEDATVNLKVILNGDDSKYVSFDNNCDDSGLCVIRNNSSFNPTTYTLTLNVNNAPNGYKIGYYYGYNENGTLASTGPTNYMPTIVSSKPTTASVALYQLTNENFTQSAMYNGQNGRFITYLVGVALDGPINGSGLYYENNEITFNATFSQNGTESPIVDNNWIRLYGTESVDGIRPVSASLPYSTSNIGDPSKYVKKPGNLTVTKNGDIYTVSIKDFELLLNNKC